MSLPPEILDHIFSLLQSDPVSLDACCKSHPQLSQLAERYLYTMITIQAGDVNIVDQQFHVFEPSNLTKLLSINPHIIHYVNTLKILIFDFRDSHTPIREYLWKISLILPKFSMLKKIELEFDPFPSWDLEGYTWPMLPLNFQTAFLGCLQLPSVTDIGITSVPLFPLSALDDCKNLKNLSLIDFTHDSSDIQTPHREQLSALESLSIRNIARQSIHRVSTWMQSYSVRSLDFRNSFGHDFDKLSDLLAKCSNSLTNLHLGIGIGFRNYYEIDSLNSNGPLLFDIIPLLPSLPNLKHLTISAGLEYVYGSCDRHLPSQLGFLSPIPAITQFLGTIPFLEHLTLDLHFLIDGHHYRSNFIPLADVVFSPLVHLLSSSPSSSTTLRISVSEISISTTPITPDSVVSSFLDCAQLAQFVERGELVMIPVIQEGPATPSLSASLSTNVAAAPLSLTASSLTNTRSRISSRKWLTRLFGAFTSAWR